MQISAICIQAYISIDNIHMIYLRILSMITVSDIMSL